MVLQLKCDWTLETTATCGRQRFWIKIDRTNAWLGRLTQVSLVTYHKRRFVAFVLQFISCAFCPVYIYRAHLVKYSHQVWDVASILRCAAHWNLSLRLSSIYIAVQEKCSDSPMQGVLRRIGRQSNSSSTTSKASSTWTGLLLLRSDLSERVFGWKSMKILDCCWWSTLSEG